MNPNREEVPCPLALERPTEIQTAFLGAMRDSNAATMLSNFFVTQQTPDSRSNLNRPEWFTKVGGGRELSIVTKSGADSWRFARFSGVICGIFAQTRFGNNHEGSIPFTRSVHYKTLTNKCK